MPGCLLPVHSKSPTHKSCLLQPKRFSAIDWLRLADCNNKNKNLVVQATFGDLDLLNEQLSQLENLPKFGGNLAKAGDLIEQHSQKHPLQPKALRSYLMLLMCIIHNEFPEIEFSPQLPFLGAVLLSHLTPAETYSALCCIINADKKLRAKYVLTLTRFRWNLWIQSVFQIVTERIPILGKHFAHIGVTVEHIEPSLACYLCNLLSWQTLVQMTAPVLLEGSKVILRFLLAFFELEQRLILECQTADEFCDFMSSADRASPPVDAIVSTAFAVRELRKADISRRIRRIETSNTESRSRNIENVDRPFHIPHRDHSSDIFSDIQLVQTWQWLDGSLQFQDCRLLFSTNLHGYNLRRFFEICCTTPNTILAIKDIDGRVFGAFASSPWSRETLIAGSPDCFLFTFAHPEPHKFDATGTNNLYQISSARSIQMGGGGDGAGLRIEDTLQEGATHWCETFDNDPLIPDAEFFAISFLEVWAVVGGGLGYQKLSN
eukprot:c1558_g1_i1.p1 GENE.c1558_g1_i1~~c1558_g1_i1.p1  ORF type:complete len:490 (+),score=101.14 c1558_g1_i1:136-1605(+)